MKEAKNLGGRSKAPNRKDPSGMNSAGAGWEGMSNHSHLSSSSSSSSRDAGMRREEPPQPDDETTMDGWGREGEDDRNTL
jgi:hypothetical protein